MLIELVLIRYYRTAYDFAIVKSFVGGILLSINLDFILFAIYKITKDIFI